MAIGEFVRANALVLSIVLTVVGQLPPSVGYSANLCADIFATNDYKALIDLPTQQNSKGIRTGHPEIVFLSAQVSRASAHKFATLRETYFSTLSSDLIDSISDYTANGHEVINSFLRGLPEPPPNTGVVRRDFPVRETVALLDRALENGIILPKGLVLFRGVSSDCPPPATVGKSGLVSIDRAYLSTTTSLDMAVGHAFKGRTIKSPTIYVIEVSNSETKGIFGTAHEEEIILRRSSRFQYDSTKQVALPGGDFVNMIFLSTAKNPKK